MKTKCVLQNDEYGHFIDIENNIFNYYPDNFKFMRKKYNLLLYKHNCNNVVKNNVNILTTIDELKSFNFNLDYKLKNKIVFSSYVHCIILYFSLFTILFYCFHNSE